MSRVRVSVEWVFDDIVNYFKLVDFEKKLKGLSSVGKIYTVSALLRNQNVLMSILLTLKNIF